MIDDSSSHTRTPIVEYGLGVVAKIFSYVQRENFQRILLVTGRDSFQNSGASKQLEGLFGISSCRRWFDYQSNFDASDVLVGLGVINDFNPDLVIGVGGGGAMDMAKLLVSLNLEEFEGRQSRDYGSIFSSTRNVRDRSLVLVPTTSGSGSESTHFAVVYQGEEKYSVAGIALRPDKVFLDPLLVLSGSDHQRAVSGIDAFCQAVESLWASNATESSRRNAKRALILLSRNLRKFVLSPDEKLASAMCIGSHLAGRAIDVSKTTAAHALSYSLTKRFGVPHGNAVAMTLGWFMDEHSRVFYDDVQLNPRVSKSNLCRDLELISRILKFPIGSGRQWMQDYLEDIGLVANIHDLAMSESDIDEIITRVNLERLSNNPVLFSPTDLKRMFLAVL